MRPIPLTAAAAVACALLAFATLRGADRGPAAADGPAPATVPSTRPATVTRTYDVRELLVIYPDFVAPELSHSSAPQAATGPRVGEVEGPFGHTGGPSDTRETREYRRNALVEFLRESVDPDSWKDAGGDVGSIHPQGGLLAITQTPEAQTKIRAVLDELLAMHGRTVRVRAHWVQAQRRDIESALRPANGKAGAALLEVDAAALDRLAGGTIHYRGEVVCMDDQRVFVTSALLHPVAGGGGGAAGTPGDGDGPDASPAVLSTGLSMDVLPSLNIDGKSVTVTLRVQTTPTAPPDQAARRPAPATRPATRPARGDDGADAAVFALQYLNTTARLPLGRMVLVGGMSLGPAADPVREPDPPQLYLFVEVTAD